MGGLCRKVHTRDIAVKPVYASKINILQLLTIAIGLASTWGIIPDEHKVRVLETLVLIGPIVTIVFRTWFTSLPITWGDE